MLSRKTVEMQVYLSFLHDFLSAATVIMIFISFGPLFTYTEYNRTAHRLKLSCPEITSIVMDESNLRDYHLYMSLTVSTLQLADRRQTFGMCSLISLRVLPCVIGLKK